MTELSQNLVCELHDPKKRPSKDWRPRGSSADSKPIWTRMPTDVHAVRGLR